jgi:hypothetical protein
MSGAEKPTPEKSVQDFLQRWSRRKLGIADPDHRAEAPAPLPPSQPGEAEPAQLPEGSAEAPPEPAPVFDPKSLPPIESIDATTDIRAFFAPGVPAELTRAALRRAWTSDPAIRDFVGIAENQWDFTNPDAVPGFGSLEFGEQLRSMVARLFGQAPAEAGQNPAERSDSAISEETEQAKMEVTAANAPTRAGSAAASLAAPSPVPHCDTEPNAAPQNDPAAEDQEQAPRRHGGALPK